MRGGYKPLHRVNETDTNLYLSNQITTPTYATLTVVKTLCTPSQKLADMDSQKIKMIRYNKLGNTPKRIFRQQASTQTRETQNRN